MENTDYFDENQEAAIMGIVRSAMVCLHSLLEIKKNRDCEEILEELLEVCKPRERECPIGNLATLQERFIVENLSEILFDDKFENFRNNLIKNLNDNNQKDKAALFKERLDIARSLPNETKQILNNVVFSLKDNKQKFLDWLFFKFFETEHHTTQAAITTLAFDYLPNMYYPLNYPVYSEYTYFNTTPPGKIKSRLYRSLISDPSNDEIIKFIQIISSGVLANSDHNYIWKLNEDLNVEELELSELKKILEIATNYDGEDLSEKISLLLELSEDPIIIQFKQEKLSKTRLEQLKYKLR